MMMQERAHMQHRSGIILHRRCISLQFTTKS